MYNYDNGGNITSRVIYPYTTASDLSNVTPTETIAYQYGNSVWKDLLTSYNGQSFVYDTIGNPTTYRGNTLTWSGGRNLASFSNADNSITYTYDANGYRATKTVNGVKSTYEYVGDKLVYEKRGNMDIYYFYDAYGNLSAVRYDDTIYYAVCNSRGDVEAFYGGTSGTMHSRYIYDTWGNLIKVVNANGNEITDQSDIAFINPIRYRGYYYDSETGLYYLKSRYYDPEVGRFINADGYVSTGQGVLGHNMFAYCGNNAVNRADYTGSFMEFFKSVGRAALDIGKKVYNAGKKFGKALKNSFCIEGGLGFGFGLSGNIGGVDVSASAYQDGFTKGMKNSDSYQAIKGHAGVTGGFGKNQLGFSTDYEHRFSTNFTTDWDDHCALSTPDKFMVVIRQKKIHFS